MNLNSRLILTFSGCMISNGEARTRAVAVYLDRPAWLGRLAWAVAWVTFEVM